MKINAYKSISTEEKLKIFIIEKYFKKNIYYHENMLINEILKNISVKSI